MAAGSRSVSRCSTASSGSAISIGCAATTPTNEVKTRIWHSQSIGKARSNSSVKVKRSGFISYLDGPEDPPLVSRPIPPPSTPPPPSPLHEMSHFLKDSDFPEGNYLQPCSIDTQETADFWAMVQRWVEIH